AGPVGTQAALRITARLAFIFFWPAYAGPALAALFGRRFAALARRARAFGLSFAAALVVHLTLVAWLTWSGHAPSRATFAIFGVGVVCAAALTLFSIPRLAARLRPAAWRVLRTVATNVLMFDFAFDFFRPPPLTSLLRLAAYAPFQALVVAGVGLRLLTWIKPLVRPARAGAATPTA
ncbi:MAG: hypothetical protein ACRDQZ_20910, partial [Mycobacteriales bacterium]